jgi:CsoR family transcriptional regulator, copper-sensing transcriptional repressor
MSVAVNWVLNFRGGSDVAKRNTSSQRGATAAAGDVTGGGAESAAGTTAACGCGACEPGEGRKAVAVDAGAKTANLARLRRIEGQIRGIHKMIEGDRYCADIVNQVSAVQEALRGVTRELLRNHLRHCVASAFTQGGAAAEQVTEELADLFHKASR